MKLNKKHRHVKTLIDVTLIYVYDSCVSRRNSYIVVHGNK